MECSISIFLDTRREKEKEAYPLKLRVYSNRLKKAKLYPVNMDLTIEEFQRIWKTERPRTEYKEKRIKLKSIESKANEVAESIIPFSFPDFEKKLFRRAGDGDNVFYHYEVTIKKFQSLERFGTASNYNLSLKSLKDFIVYKKHKEPKKLSFLEITSDWLTSYESYMINHKKRSRTTVSMYLRALRTIFNIAISEKEIDQEIYPFGKRKYQVPTVKNVKKALTKEELKILFEAEPRTDEQKKARDFWFFSYACNGVNIKDIALLKWENLKNDKIVFYRAKTINTSKADLRPVTVYLNDFTTAIIEKYGNGNKEQNELMFPFIASGENQIDSFRKIKNFTRSINQNVKKLAVDNGLTSEISTYWARHSFATNAIRSGASMEFVSEALNHSDLRTTQGYFAGFEEKDKKELMKNIMSF
ncbi:MAG: site-specific integrase [Chitinophagaceae bacterium]